MRPARFLILLIPIACGCVQTAMVKSWKPAELAVPGMDHVAVTNFLGEQGEAFASALTLRLWENSFYKVVEPLELGQEILPASFQQSSATAISALLSPAKDLGVDGVLVGEVVECRCEDRRLGDSASQTDASAAKGLLARRTLVREANVVVEFRLLDARTGETKISRRVTHQYVGKSLAGERGLPDEEEILQDLTQRCVDDIVTLLAPYEADSSMPLARCNVWTVGRRDVRLGAEYAEAGDWGAAEQAWNKALTMNSGNHAAMYNLAVCAAHRQDYRQAEALAMQALSLQHQDCYAEGLQRIRSHRTEYEKTETQKDVRDSAE